MAEISEKQARRICEALGLRRPDTDRIRLRDEMTGDSKFSNFGEPVWRIVQRAAAEAEEKKP